MLLGCLSGIGILLYVGMQPTVSMQTASGLPEADQAAIQKLLEPGEEVVYAVTRGVTDFSEESSCLTDRRALSWMSYHDPVTVESVRYDEIAKLAVQKAATFMDTPYVRVESRAGAVVLLYAPNDELELRRFENHIRRQMVAQPTVADDSAAGDASVQAP